ncbi:MAG: endolytic transglycosylase MltG, partial [Oscillospiraceae bacterium]|nr:endolytic transglycosylase MltG [Oscillospiraceae bacterium]
YQFYLGESAANVIEKLLDGFDYRFTEDHRAAIDTLNVKLSAMMKDNGYDDAYIATQHYDVRKVLIVASLIEEETANSDESYKIASVIYNRLTNQKEYPYLNIDATLMYVLGHKDALTTEDLNYESPYNTNINKGLIPGPITNPGLNSINAALNPDGTNYHYYVLDTKSETREHHFSETYDDHVNFVNSLKEGE